MTKKLDERPVRQTDYVLHFDDELCSIGKAAKFLKVSVDSLRRWEKRGLITPQKTPGGTRYYALDQLKTIKSKAPGRLCLSKLILSEEAEKKQTPQASSTDGSLSYIKPEIPTPFEQAVKSVDHLALAKELTSIQASNLPKLETVTRSFNLPLSSVMTTIGLSVTTLGLLVTGVITSGYLTNPKLAAKFAPFEPFNSLAKGYISLVLPFKAQELGFNQTQQSSNKPKPLAQESDASADVLAATTRSGTLTINANTAISGTLTIAGDIVVTGTNIQGLVRTITAGDNITVSNADPSNPTISVSLPTNLVNSFATSTTGTQVSGDIILGSGLSLATGTKTITVSTPTLSSVRSAGGCSGCIKDDDVESALTISSSGSVDVGALSGKVTAAKGGTAIDTSGSTGVPSIASGTWTVNTTLPVTLGGLGADVTPAGAGELIYSSSTSAYTHLASGTSGYVLSSGGAGAPVWVSQSSISASSAFSNITSGTNTQAAMIVGAGASLSYTSTGTIDASSLIGATWVSPGTIGSTTATTGKFTTLNATTALQINGTQLLDSSRNITNMGTIMTNTFTSTALTFGGADPVITGTTTLNINTTSGTGSVLLGGGSGSTGCTLNDSTGDFTCVGSITGGSSGSQGYWGRSVTTLSPVTSGDSVTTSGNISATGTGTITSGGLLTASNGLTLTTGALSLTATSGSAALTLTSSATAFNINSGLFNVDTTGSKVGIGDESPDAKLDIDSSSTSGADFLITNTGVGLSGTIAGITANSVTTGDIVTLSATALSSGSMLIASGPTSTGVTDHFVKLSSDIGSAASLLNLNPDFSGSAVTGYGVYNIATDATANANTNYGYYGSLALSGNAAKTGVGIYSTVTSSSTTGDTLVALDLATSATGALAATQTRTIYGIRSQPASTGASANADDTLNLYGGYFAPSSTLATAGTDNVYGQYITTTATHAVDAGTLNQYGLYIANGTSGTNGTAAKYGLYVESPTGADTNYAAIFAGGNVGVGLTGPGYKLDIATSTASDRGINIGNTAATGTNYGIYSSVTGAATANIGGYFVATGATTSRGLEVAALTSATSTGLTIGALSGTTANTGLSVGTLSGTGASSTGLTIGAISSTGASQRGILLSTLTGGTTANYQIQVGAITSIDGAANSFLNLGAITGGGATATNVAMDVGNISATGGNDFGIRLGTLTGGTTANYQITTGILTSATTTTNAQLNLGGVVTTGGTTNYGINVGALSGTGTTNYGINVVASTATGTTNYGMKIGAISGAASGTNYGLYVDTVSGAATNYAAIFARGNVGVGTVTPATLLELSSTTAGANMLQITNTDAGAFGPLLTIYHDSASPAASDEVGALSFAAKSSTDTKRTFTNILSRVTDPTNASEDAELEFYNIRAGTLTEAMSLDSAGTLLVNSTSLVSTTGQDYRIQAQDTGLASSDGDGGTLALFSTTAATSGADVGTALTFGGYYTGTSTAAWSRIRGPKTNSTDTNYSGYLAFDTRTSGGNLTEKMRIDNTGLVTTSGGIAIGTNPSTTGALRLAYLDSIIARNSANSADGVVIQTTDASTITIGGATFTNVVLGNNGKVFVGDTTNGNMGSGITINQQEKDDEIISLKSSDVSHSLTSLAEADTYGYFKKLSATSGGLWVEGLTDPGVSSGALYLVGANSDTADTTKSTAGLGVVRINAGVLSGTNRTTVGANGNLVSIENNGSSKFLFDAEGTGHADDVWTDNAFDLAEDYPVRDGAVLEPGDVVSLVENPGKVDKSTSPYNKELLGVVSYHTAQLSGVLSNDQPRDAVGNLLGYKPIALSGRVPVKVTTENGPIKRGDYLTSSGTPGYTMKSTKPGIVIGRALEDYSGSGSSPEACGSQWQKEYNPLPSDTGPCQKILAFVNVSFADPQNLLANLSIDQDGLLIVPNLKIKITDLPDVGGITIENNGSQTLTSQFTNVGEKLLELETFKLVQTQNQSDVYNKLAELETKVSGVSTSSAQLVEQTGSNTTTLAQSAAQIASHSSELTSLQTQIDLLNTKLTAPQTLFASDSATLSDLKVTSDATISGKLAALGEVRLGNTLIAGNLAIDGFFSIASNAINVIGSSLGDNQTPTDGILYLQNSPLSNLIDLFNGLVTISKHGLLTVQKLAVSNQSLDTVVIKAGSTSIEVTTNELTDKSKIFVSATLPIPIAVTKKDIPGHKFTISLGSAQGSDVSVDWWIVDQK